jgi:DNA damage-binding protein 1
VTPVLAILHRDHQQRIQLLSRELNIEQFELSLQPAVLLQPTQLSTASFPSVDSPPILVPVLANPDNAATGLEESFPGGVAIVGGRKIVVHQLAPAEWQQKRKKQKRESKRKSSSASTLSKSRDQDKTDSKSMKRKPYCSVEWPFGEVHA